MALPGRKTLGDGVELLKALLFEHEGGIQQAYLNAEDEPLVISLKLKIKDDKSGCFKTDAEISYVVEKAKGSRAGVTAENETPIEQAITVNRREILFRQFSWPWFPGPNPYDGCPKINLDDYTAPPFFEDMPRKKREWNRLHKLLFRVF